MKWAYHKRRRHPGKITAKFIGGAMDGTVMVIPRAIPRYRFPRYQPTPMCVTEAAAPNTNIWTEDYELDSWEGDRVFYRRVGLPPQ